MSLFCWEPSPDFISEGPYISSVDGYRGSHPLKYICKPNWEEFLSIYETSGKSILQVTIAPELEGALEFIDKCKAKGIVVALGHHNASAEMITEAIDHGASIAIHIGDGLAKTIDPHFNPLWPQLSDDRLLISIIGDGFRLRPEEIRVFYKAKGPDNTIIARMSPVMLHYHPEIILRVRETLLNFQERVC